MEALLYLEDGTVIAGKGFGYKTTRVGELVFNTAMTGYQKTLTDPSYMGQIITMTYPLIGNYGISSIDNESDKIYAFGVVAKDVCFTPSNSNCIMNIDEWLKEMKIPGVWNVDTRKITKKIRNEGTIKCVISNEGISVEEAQRLCAQTELRGDFMKDASINEKQVISAPENTEVKKVAVLDFGVKKSILDGLNKRGCELHMFPYGTSAEEIMSINPHGIFLTNGPGDPAEATEAIEITRQIMGNVPTFGICMGHQILALAAGGNTYKLKYGHRGGNHGVYDKDTNRSYITSQNHGYAVDSNSIILKGMEVTHINLNDGTVEGMKHRDLPIFSVQYHPEASPGPNDNEYLFDRFIDMMKGGVL
ncbi:MAG: glutamine-hydrolyzing carbamoyl-phosphate synthase small subunit [Aminipila sp.]